LLFLPVGSTTDNLRLTGANKLSLFLKRDGGRGREKTLFPGKEVFPFPAELQQRAQLNVKGFVWR
jgi:hypothetical protein